MRRLCASNCDILPVCFKESKRRFGFKFYRIRRLASCRITYVACFEFWFTVSFNAWTEGDRDVARVREVEGSVANMESLRIAATNCIY